MCLRYVSGFRFGGPWLTAFPSSLHSPLLQSLSLPRIAIAVAKPPIAGQATPGYFVFHPPAFNLSLNGPNRATQQHDLLLRPSPLCRPPRVVRRHAHRAVRRHQPARADLVREDMCVPSLCLSSLHTLSAMDKANAHLQTKTPQTTSAPSSPRARRALACSSSPRRSCG